MTTTLRAPLSKIEDLTWPKCSIKKAKKNSIEDELRIFESLGELGPKFQELVNALMLIRPTSVDAERAFSICGLIDTAKRSRLSPQKLSALLFIHQNIDSFH